MGTTPESHLAASTLAEIESYLSELEQIVSDMGSESAENVEQIMRRADRRADVVLAQIENKRFFKRLL